ncbi:MAG TPA: hypothetical protein VGP33_16700 [Chloroflexota bacterium]|nr:hypothetical protein [Chloroflexota bacterium]
MNDASAEVAAAQRAVVVATIVERESWQREAERQRQEAERWQRRVELAERHQEFELATTAAQRARHHAGLALAAEQHLSGARDEPAAAAAPNGLREGGAL